ncbi:MAG: hypothetical protein PWR27_1925 [Petroclostridium sp.]|jgi:hypothetical protein|nr:hypothetical protein [Clostridia bacterium]MDK2811216.1 hypothetical protein [Petroclostridium sp.]
MDTSNAVQIRKTLDDIKSKIDQCDSLSRVLESFQRNDPIPENWNRSIEEGIIGLYISLVQICKQKNII